jgi:UDP-N-acetylmuramate--alanine ligase
VVLTNIELDHLDYYKNLDDYLDAFREFVSLIPMDGVLIGNGDDPNVREIATAAQCEVVFFDGDSENLNKLNLAVPGHHNRMNALAAFTVGLVIGGEEEAMVSSLNSFTGTWRRFEFKGHCNGSDVYDDYAHHPTEVRAALQAAREKYPDHRVVAVFQPHQHSRTKHFLNEFAEAFDLADEVIIPNIYKVRDSEENVKSISLEGFVDELKKHHDTVRNGDGLEATIEYLKGSVSENDFVLVMGAGDVWKVADGLI